MAISTSQIRVLLIDDNVDAVEMMKILLEARGFQTEIAFNGADGLRMAQQFRPDVVISDIGMPIKDGYAVAEELRNSPEFHSTYLVALTGWTDEATRKRVIKAGFDRHLGKPVKWEQLFCILDEHFPDQRS